MIDNFYIENKIILKIIVLTNFLIKKIITKYLDSKLKKLYDIY